MMYMMIMFFFLPLTMKAMDEPHREIPEPFPSWTFWLTGGTHFYQGRTGRGILFSGLETGLIATGILYDDQLKKHSNSPYYNYPLYLGMNLYGVDKIDFAKRNLDHFKYHQPDFAYDPVSFNDLMKEPFRLRNILTPITGSFVALAILQLYIESGRAEYNISRVEQIHFLDRYMAKNQALPLFAMISMGMSWEAGVGEEYWMRNYLMPILDYRMGKRKGLLVTSAIFGGMHAFNYLLVQDPDPLMIITHVGFATALGYVLGKNVQHNNYKIGKAVAAHTWYDFTLMLGSFLVNPKENVFGVDVKLRL